MKPKPKKSLPLYEQVAESIRTDIASGKIRPDEQIESHQLLAKKHGVSLITVRRALTDLANEGLVYSRGRRGTFAQKPGPRRSSLELSTIGVVLQDLRSPFFSLIVQSLEAYSSYKGYNLLISNSAQQLEKEENLIRHYYDIGVSGMIIASMTHEYTASHFLRKINDEHYPLIVVSYIKDPDVYFVGTDHEEGGYMATKHLVDAGYRRIGYINGEQNNAVGELRRNGYIRALKDAGLPLREEFIYQLRKGGEWHDYSSGYEIGETFVRLADRPEAMFIYNDLSALGFEQAVLNYGFAVPDDVAIVGFDGIERAQYAPVPLTTIEQPFDRIGSLAVENLIKRIEGQPVNIKTELQPKLVIRASCGAHREKPRL
jgi:DNA-binding LacI/PurR family transcriptional regulator